MVLEENLTNLLSIITPVPEVSTIFKIFQAVGIVILIYLVILIIKTVLQYRDSKNLSQIAKNVEQINLKLDAFINSNKRKKKL